jgi:4-diphosphocytidyl-2-C-methyl-D-erythritol kinase
VEDRLVSGTLPSRWPAPAKLNLFLHVTGRRADGYHLLQTVFQFVDWCDFLEFTPTGDGRVLRIAGNDAVAPADDLTARAATLLKRHTACGNGVRIRVTKRIPLGGGLGGGSSDAATTLVALNHLWKLGLDRRSLLALALQIGADVPVFVHGHAAWAEGIGEVLEDIEPPQPWYLVVCPGCSVSTARVFSDPKLTRNTPEITIHDFLAGRAGNDCEAVVRRLYPQVASALEWLTRYAPGRLTGTGACVFAAFAQRDEADGVLRRLPREWTGFVARGVNRSPLRCYVEV